MINGDAETIEDNDVQVNVEEVQEVEEVIDEDEFTQDEEITEQQNGVKHALSQDYNNTPDDNAVDNNVATIQEKDNIKIMPLAKRFLGLFDKSMHGITPLSTDELGEVDHERRSNMRYMLLIALREANKTYNTHWKDYNRNAMGSRAPTTADEEKTNRSSYIKADELYNNLETQLQNNDIPLEAVWEGIKDFLLKGKGKWNAGRLEKNTEEDIGNADSYQPAKAPSLKHFLVWNIITNVLSYEPNDKQEIKVIGEKADTPEEKNIEYTIDFHKGFDTFDKKGLVTWIENELKTLGLRPEAEAKAETAPAILPTVSQ